MAALTIHNFKQKMEEKCTKRGIYENFGQKEIRDLKDRYHYDCYSLNPAVKEMARLIDKLNDWCMDYTGRA